MVNTYSKAASGLTALSANFKVKEFACKDGTDTVLIDSELVTLLQKIRDHFGVAVSINSGYRTPSYNKAVGGVTNSQHVKGTAADIALKGVSPLEVAQYAEYLMPKSGGIGVYGTFTHVDVREKRSRWDSRSGVEQAVDGWPGYEPAAWYEQAQERAVGLGLTDGKRPLEATTRAESWTLALRVYDAVLDAVNKNTG